MDNNLLDIEPNKKPRKRPSIGAWVMIAASTTFIVVMLSLFFFGNPAPNNQRAEVEAYFLSDSEMAQPIFRFVKQYDPENFKAMMDEATRLVAARKPGATAISDPTMLNFGQRFASKYYRQASGEIIMKHFATQIKVMKELNSIEPLLVCKQSFPQIYGSIQRDEWLKAKSLPEFTETFRLLIESGARGQAKEIDKEAPNHLRAFGEDFKKKFPAEQVVLKEAFASKPVKDVSMLAKSIILFNEEMQKLPPEKAIMIRRLIHGSS